MKNWDPVLIKETIKRILPEGRVIPRHNDFGHFYEVVDGAFTTPPIYPSVTGKLQVLKDEGLMNYKMNRALDYIFANFKEFDDANIMEHLDKASKVSVGILEDAGSIGSVVHDTRELIFSDWIRTGVEPTDYLSYIKKLPDLPPGFEDVRAISAIRALKKFVDERKYMPIACELLLYNHKLKVAGTLDDLGMMECETFPGSGIYKYEFVLVDLKTSNQFKDHYFFQVALYWWMFSMLTGIKPARCFIVKLSKENGEYKIEELKKPAKLAMYARAMLKTNEGVDFIKSLRKDNQKVVAPVMQL